MPAVTAYPWGAPSCHRQLIGYRFVISLLLLVLKATRSDCRFPALKLYCGLSIFSGYFHSESLHIRVAGHSSKRAGPGVLTGEPIVSLCTTYTQSISSMRLIQFLYISEPYRSTSRTTRIPVKLSLAARANPSRAAERSLDPSSL